MIFLLKMLILNCSFLNLRSNIVSQIIWSISELAWGGTLPKKIWSKSPWKKLLYLPLPVFEVSFLNTSAIWNLRNGNANSKYFSDTILANGAERSKRRLIFLSLSSKVKISLEKLFKSSVRRPPIFSVYSNGLLFISA